MKTGLARVRNLLLVLLLLALIGCGATNTKTADDNGASTLLTAKTLFKDSEQVTKIRLQVTGALTNTGAAYSTVRQDFDGPAGSLTGGTIDVYPGSNLIVSAQAFDDQNNMLFEGFATDVTIIAGTPRSVQISMKPPVIKATDTPCITCHESTRDVTGQNLVADYKQSGHYSNITWTSYTTNGSRFTGCAGCHGTQHNDVTPSSSGRCFKCHDGIFKSTMHQNASAFYAGIGFPARYLSAGNNNCSACHEPHNPIKGTGYRARQEWSSSAHGDVNAAAWTHYDFTTKSTCVACHTPAGFIKALNSGWTDTTAPSATVSSGKQPLTCDGCHSSNDFKNSVRTLSGGYKAGMGGYGNAALASIQYPNVGQSNICIPCHAGRENGASLKAGTTDFTNAGFKNPHYLAAGAVFYGQGGFQFYTSGVRYNTYGAAGNVGRNANWSHGKLGMDNYSAYDIPRTSVPSGVTIGTGNKGQCVACHLGPKNSHLFDAVATANTTQGNSGNKQGCYGCHGGTSMSMDDFVNGERVIWNRLFDFFAWNLVKKADGTPRATPIYFSNTAAPGTYFFTDASYTIALTDWTRTVTGGTGEKTMGAAMNLKLLSAEKGSFMHNQSFSQALIADSIVYLQNGSVGDRTVVSPTENGIITFTGYSTAFPTDPSGNGVSISALKLRLTKSATGTSGFVRR